jgi:cohesin loading factor subunit SCC2
MTLTLFGFSYIPYFCYSLLQWLRLGGAGRIHLLAMGLEAASIILSIATSQGVDRRAINDDAIEASISLMRLHLSRHLVPALNQTGHLLASQDKTMSPEPAKKRRRSGNGIVSGSSKDIKKVYKRILSTVHLQLLLMERLEQLVENLPLDDQQILMLTSGVLPALELDCNSTPLSNATTPGQQLQLATISVVTATFRKYPMHRETILEDLFPVMLRLPTGKRSLRSFALRYSSASSPQALSALNEAVVGDLICKGGTPHFIQMISALILSLVQACVRRPAYEVAGEATENVRWFSGLQSCQTVADFFVDQLLKRCALTKDGAGALEFRPMLTNIVEDFLMVFLIPEYPGAEFLLASLTRRLTHDLGQASPTFRTGNSKSTPEATYMTVAFDALGKICAVQARILAQQQERDLILTTDVPQRGEADEMELSCYCKSKACENIFLVGCEHCKTYVHGKCVGIPNSPSIPKEWNCDSCRLGHILSREHGKYQSQETEDLIDISYVMRHAFQCALAHRLGATGIEDAKHVHLARWLGEVEQKCNENGLNTQQHKVVTELLEFWEKPGPSGEIMTEEGGIRLILFLAAKTSPLIKSFRNQLRFILKLMSDTSSHSLRKLSLKAIEKVSTNFTRFRS